MSGVSFMALLATASSFSAPLDSVSAQPKFAGSLRQLRTAYAGKAITVRRSSDNATQDIGFVGGMLDTASIASFCGAGNGFVTQIFDQSTNATAAIAQATAANQPQIYNGSVVQTVPALNSRPALKFDGAAMFFTGATQTTYFGAAASGIIAVQQAAGGGVAAGNFNDLLPFGTVQGDSTNYGSFGFIGPATNTLFAGFATNTTATIPVTFTDTSIIMMRLSVASTIFSIYRNGGTAATGTANTATTSDTQLIGKNFRGNFFNGFMPEWYFYGTLPSQADSNIIGNNAAAYYGLTWTNI